MEHTPSSEKVIEQEVNEIFVEVAKIDILIGLSLAAFELSQPLVEVRSARHRHNEDHKKRYKSISPSERLENGLASMGAGYFPGYGYDASHEPSELAKAEQALGEARKITRGRYGLTRFEAFVALHLSRTYFE